METWRVYYEYGDLTEAVGIWSFGPTNSVVIGRNSEERHLKVLEM